ncbi:MAG: DNA/RNA nuclease SfsA [Clostridiales bacterium]|nr:DNA/RNA nuclease SfsA [Clostridiales bacterium]
MKYIKKIIEAEFIDRPNRFNARVLLGGKEIVVHVPNTGRCKELLIKGTTVLLREELNPNRKTQYDLIAVYKLDKLINIDSQIPNKVVKEALEKKLIKELSNYTEISSEKTFGNSRFDFKLSNNKNEEYYLEVKGVTLEENGECKFPDAPTERGKKHLLELIEAKKSGKGAGVLFLIQMKDVISFSPNFERDPLFSEALIKAKNDGVDIFVYCCKVDEEQISLYKKIPLIL